MKRELEEKLVVKYPSLYRDYRGDMRQTCMTWGFEHGDGWYHLVDELSSRVDRYNVVAIQVKEKFGGLRFYYQGPPGMSDKNSEIVENIVDIYENLSYHTCEICGNAGVHRDEGGWMETLCTKCYNKKYGVEED